MKDETPWLHIVSQCSYHQEAEIVGTRAGLTAVLFAVQSALKNGDGEALAFSADGEGYSIKASRRGGVSQIGKPVYLEQIAQGLVSGERDWLISHYRLIRKQDAEAMDALRWCRANGNPHRSEPV